MEHKTGFCFTVNLTNDLLSISFCFKLRYVSDVFCLRLLHIHWAPSSDKLQRERSRDWRLVFSLSASEIHFAPSFPILFLNRRSDWRTEFRKINSEIYFAPIGPISCSCISSDTMLVLCCKASHKICVSSSPILFLSSWIFFKFLFVLRPFARFIGHVPFREKCVNEVLYLSWLFMPFT